MLKFISTQDCYRTSITYAMRIYMVVLDAGFARARIGDCLTCIASGPQLAQDSVMSN
jgi:hypothetical protein